MNKDYLKILKEIETIQEDYSKKFDMVELIIKLTDLAQSLAGPSSTLVKTRHSFAIEMLKVLDAARSEHRYTTKECQQNFQEFIDERTNKSERQVIRTAFLDLLSDEAAVEYLSRLTFSDLLGDNGQGFIRRLYLIACKSLVLKQD